MRKLFAVISLMAVAGCAHQPEAGPLNAIAVPAPVQNWVRCDLVFDSAGALGGYAQLVGVPIADSVDKQTRGLSGELTPGTPAMMFTWFSPQRRPVWMNGVHVPLSVAFLDRDGYVTQIENLEPETNQYHWSAAPIVAALEVGQGTFERLGVHVGSRMDVQQCNGPIIYPDNWKASKWSPRR